MKIDNPAGHIHILTLLGIVIILAALVLLGRWQTQMRALNQNLQEISADVEFLDKKLEALDARLQTLELRVEAARR